MGTLTVRETHKFSSQILCLTPESELDLSASQARVMVALRPIDSNFMGRTNWGLLSKDHTPFDAQIYLEIFLLNLYHLQLRLLLYQRTYMHFCLSSSFKFDQAQEKLLEFRLFMRSAYQNDLFLILAPCR